MKLLCLVALAVCGVVQGANPEGEILPPGISITKNFERSQYDLQIPATNIVEIDNSIPSKYEGKNEVHNRIISGAIEDALEQLRDVIINGNDDVPVLDPFEVPLLGPYEYALVTGVRARGDIRSLRVEGLRWFIADRIEIRPARLTVGITLTLPWLTVTGGYNANARIGLITHNAGGDFRIFAHRVEVSVDMRMGTNIFAGHLVLRELNIKIDINDTHVSITGMTGSTILNQLISSTIQSITQDLIQNQLENVSQLLSKELFDTINDVLKDYTISDIFGGYNANARIGLITHNAGGDFRIFAHRVEVSVDMRMGTNIFAGHLVLRELNIKIDINDTHVSITGMTGSTILNQLISSTIQSITQDLIQNQLENVSQLLSKELFDTINDVLKDYTISDIFG